MKKAIVQRDKMGCGVACVAFITGVGYKKARDNYFKNPKHASTVGYTCMELREALAMGKLSNYKQRFAKGMKTFRTNTIVFIKRSKKYPFGHYLVKTNERWMDPWINMDYRKPDLKNACAGFRNKLPGKPVFVVYPV